MLRRIINYYAVKLYKKELNELIEFFSNLSNKNIADVLVVSVWDRAGLQLEGYFKLPNGEIIVSPYLCDYTSMWNRFDKIISTLKAKGLHIQATGMSIWTYSLKGLINDPKMNDEIDHLWKLLMDSEPYWNQKLDELYKDDISKMEMDVVNKVKALSQDILNYLPPKYYWEYDTEKQFP